MKKVLKMKEKLVRKQIFWNRQTSGPSFDREQKPKPGYKTDSQLFSKNKVELHDRGGLEL